MSDSIFWGKREKYHQFVIFPLIGSTLLMHMGSFRVSQKFIWITVPLGWEHSFMGIDHEIFSSVILSLPLIQEGQLSVSGERMCTILVNPLEDLACPVNVWLGTCKLTMLDMTQLGWLGRKTATQTNKPLGWEQQELNSGGMKVDAVCFFPPILHFSKKY